MPIVIFFYKDILWRYDHLFDICPLSLLYSLYYKYNILCLSPMNVLPQIIHTNPPNNVLLSLINQFLFSIFVFINILIYTPKLSKLLFTGNACRLIMQIVFNTSTNLCARKHSHFLVEQ